jgi:hypothetical protein
MKTSKKNINKAKRGIAGKVIAAILAVSTAVSFGYCGIKKLSKQEKYKTTTTTYIEGKNPPSIEEDYKDKKDQTEEIILIEETPYTRNSYQKEKTIDKNFYVKTITEYDLSDIKLDNIEDYFDIDLSNRIIKSEEQVENYSGNIPTGDFYTEKLKKLEVIIQDLSDSKDYYNEELIALLTLTYFILLCFIELGWLTLNDTKFINSHTISYLTNEINKNIEDYKNNEKKKKELIEKLNTLLNENKILKDKFNTLYQEFIKKNGETQELRQLYYKITKEDEVLELPEDYFKVNKKVRVKK